jgi:CHAD domain-containing protein
VQAAWSGGADGWLTFSGTAHMAGPREIELKLDVPAGQMTRLRQLHKLRVRAKKLRYACEFFAGAFPGKKRSRRRTRFAGKLKRLQGALGDLNDIVVHQELAEQSATAPAAAARRYRRRRTKKAFAAGRLAGREEARFTSAMSDAERAYTAFARAKPFRA